MRWPAALALFVSLLLGSQVSEAFADSAVWTDAGTFISAPDGDTLKVRTSKHGDTIIRVSGVDSPERGQAYWRVAKAHLVEFAKSGELTVACYKLDRYKRHICRVKSGSKDLGASLLRAGLAWHYKRFDSEQPPDERALYAHLEHESRARRVGLWKQPEPMNPEECRKARRAREKCR